MQSMILLFLDMYCVGEDLKNIIIVSNVKVIINLAFLDYLSLKEFWIER